MKKKLLSMATMKSIGFLSHTNLSNNGHNNEYRFGNILFMLNKQDIHIRIYDGNASDPFI